MPLAAVLGPLIAAAAPAIIENAPDILKVLSNKSSKKRRHSPSPTTDRSPKRQALIERIAQANAYLANPYYYSQNGYHPQQPPPPPPAGYMPPGYHLQPQPPPMPNWPEHLSPSRPPQQQTAPQSGRGAQTVDGGLLESEALKRHRAESKIATQMGAFAPIKIFTQFRKQVRASSFFVNGELHDHETHKKLFDAPVNEWLKTAHFFHILAVLVNTIKQKRRAREVVTCPFCQPDANFSRYAIKIVSSREMIKLLLNSFYCCPLGLIDEVFLLVKPPCYPYSGLYGWDLVKFLYDRVRRVNAGIPVVPTEKSFFHGVMFKEEIPHYEALVHEIFRSREQYGRHIILYGVGDAQRPRHWCCLFVDFKSKAFFFYDSLADPQHVDKWLFNKINERLPESERLEFVHNSVRLQHHSKICGYYVYEFVKHMCITVNTRDEFIKSTAPLADKSRTLDEVFTREIIQDFFIVNDSKSSLFHEAAMDLFEPPSNLHKIYKTQKHPPPPPPARSTTSPSRTHQGFNTPRAQSFGRAFL